MALQAPEQALAEIRRNSPSIVERSSLSAEGVERMLVLLTEGIDVVPRQAFEDRIPVARERIGDKDPGDVPFLALALAGPCEGIWTQNVRDFEGAGIDIWTTERVLDAVGSG